jgi:hypothetical protein
MSNQTDNIIKHTELLKQEPMEFAGVKSCILKVKISWERSIAYLRHEKKIGA